MGRNLGECVATDSFDCDGSHPLAGRGEPAELEWNSMRYLLSNLRLELGEEDRDLRLFVAAALGLDPSEIQEVVLERRSVDARHKRSIHFQASIRFQSNQPLEACSLPPGAKLEPVPEPLSWVARPVTRKPRVVVVGTGPAGLFCALRLLDYGIEPVVLERGPAMSERVQRVEALWAGGPLDVSANAQFGEGGAGTFSDGKLATGIGHPAIRFVLETFVAAGADPNILYLAKPHVGTDVIRRCVVRLRQEAEARGAIFRFRNRLSDLSFAGGAVRAAILESGEEIPCDALVLALGHSARDTFEMLHKHGVTMRSKPFAMGVRIEHPQILIDRAQYGPSSGHPSLSAADYKLVCNLSPVRAAYSFCMCPGGEVIQCASELGGVVVNGMSRSRRDSGYANSGLVAKVNREDLDSEHPLAGMFFQRIWEQAAFRAAGETYGAPAQSVRDFLSFRSGGRLPESTFKPYLVPADLRTCLPHFIQDQLRSALPVFEKKIHGFTGMDALLLGVESRTSSPVQIPRTEKGQALSHEGLYPCGEGAGFAGGITSAAVDGLRVAEWIVQAAGAPGSPAFLKRGQPEPL